MASSTPPTVPMGDEAPIGAALQHRPWRKRRLLSSGLEQAEHFLEKAGFDRAPWLAVAFAGGIAAWFTLDNRWEWLGFIALLLAAAAGVMAVFAADGRFPWLRQAIAALSLFAAAGCAVVWAKSALVGAAPIARPVAGALEGRVLSREDQPAEGRVRLVLATREPNGGRPIRVRVNLPLERDVPGLTEGAAVRLKARLMPPAPPMLPGAYDFARTAWFAGLAATGSVQGEVTVLTPGNAGGTIDAAQRALSRHVRANLPGSAGSIAAALASGDRGAIAPADDEAMRNSGLAHLLSVSGLHVSAVVAAGYLLALTIMAAFPWLALRLRLPIAAAGFAALAGVAYTLLTGAEVPTVRSCIGAVLVLAALVLGRETLSLRMVALAAVLVLLAWPEALVGPSFQMSFAAVLAIVALHGAAPVRAFLAPREEPWWQHYGRRLAMLLLTGVVIELALMPIGLFHFHRAGVYGAMANVIAIPLTTFVSMPLIALALLADAIGLGAPLWWLAGKSIDAMLVLAHWTSARPGAVTLLPAMGTGSFVTFVAGGLWLALWSGRIRLLGLLPALGGFLSLAAMPAPDVLISGDGRHVGITVPGDELLVLREGRSDYATGTLSELAGMDGQPRLFADWPGAHCNADFCALAIERGGRTWRLLAARGKDMVEARALAAACDRVDIVIADRWLPASCRPAWLKADRSLLGKTGGLAIDLADGRISTVAASQGTHGWWRPRAQREPGMASPSPAPGSKGVAATRQSAGVGERPALPAAQ